MYKVYLDNIIIYDLEQEISLIEPKVSLEESKAGSFEFGITPDNTGYGQIRKLTSTIGVYKLEKGKEIEIFKGRVLEVEKDFYNIKQVYCEGELAFLGDSIQRPAEYHDVSVREFLKVLLDEHNRQVEDDKKFEAGIVTVHDSNDSLYEYTNWETTLEDIRAKLMDGLGGRISVRNEGGVRYLDYLADYSYINQQVIEFGENLLDYSENTSAADIITCLIPLGAKLEESEIEGLEAYTTIESVNGGKEYITLEDAMEHYGWVTKVQKWDDISVPSDLLRKGKEYLEKNQYETMTLSLSAIDLNLYSVEFERIELGDQIRVKSKPHGMDMFFPVTQMILYLDQPDKNTIQLGKTQKNLTSQVISGNKEIKKELDYTRQTTTWLQSAIDNATQMMTGSKGGYRVTEFDDNGRWLRDLYMNAESKDSATQVMQINMNGIGFSRTGFNGPYKNAWTIDGVLLGEFIKAGSVSAEKLSVEYKSGVTSEIEAKFNVANNLISAEVTRAKGVEEQLSASLKVTSNQILQKVSKGDVSSQLSLESGLISISGPRLKIDTEKFKVAYDGTTRLIDAYLDVSDATSRISIASGSIHILDAKANLDVGRVAFDASKKMLSIGSYGAYESFGLGYWGGYQFYPMIQINRRDGYPSVEFKDINTMSINGKEAFDGDIWFVSDIWYNADGSIHKELGKFSVNGGLILK